MAPGPQRAGPERLCPVPSHLVLSRAAFGACCLVTVLCAPPAQPRAGGLAHARNHLVKPWGCWWVQIPSALFTTLSLWALRALRGDGVESADSSLSSSKQTSKQLISSHVSPKKQRPGPFTQPPPKQHPGRLRPTVMPGKRHQLSACASLRCLRAGVLPSMGVCLVPHKVTTHGCLNPALQGGPRTVNGGVLMPPRAPSCPLHSSSGPRCPCPQTPPVSASSSLTHSLAITQVLV